MASAQNRTVISGGCHCGKVTFRLAASRPPEDLPVRACSCRFCRTHAVLSTLDPDGHVTFAAVDPDALGRYRFGLRTADFLICRDCGVYLGALMADGDAAYAIINVNACEAPERFLQSPLAMDYGGEDEAGRLARRRANWTPADPWIAEQRQRLFAIHWCLWGYASIFFCNSKAMTLTIFVNQLCLL